MDDSTFDDDWGIRSQRALTRYLKSVRRYLEAQESSEGMSIDMSKLESDVKAARQNFQFECSYRKLFAEVFHRLEKIGTQELKDGLRRYQRYLDELPTDFVDPVFEEFREHDPAVQQQREFLGNAIYELKATLVSRGEGASAAESIAARIQQQVEIEARLRQQCEDDVQKYPDQEETIRRSYRKAIDALREEA